MIWIGVWPEAWLSIDQIQLFYYSFIWAAASDMRDDGSFWELDYNVSVDTDDWAGPLVLLIQME